MKNTIWKFPLETTDAQRIQVPSRNRILTVQMQGNTPCIWAAVDADSPKEEMEIRIHGTGHELPQDAGSYAYIGTYQLHNGLVFHVFRILSPAEVIAAILG